MASENPIATLRDQVRQLKAGAEAYDIEGKKLEAGAKAKRKLAKDARDASAEYEAAIAKLQAP